VKDEPFDPQKMAEIVRKLKAEGRMENVALVEDRWSHFSHAHIEENPPNWSEFTLSSTTLSVYCKAFGE